MFLLSYNKNYGFGLAIDWENTDKDSYVEDLDILKKIFILYSPDFKIWQVPVNRIDEILLWLSYYNIEYEIYDSAVQKIKEIKETTYQKETKFSRNEVFDSGVLNKDVVPFEFQIKGINFIVRRNRCYLADDPGLGKTFQTVISFSIWYKRNKIDSVFIIVRNGLQYHWKREILEFSNQFKEDEIEIIDNDNKVKYFDKKLNPKIIIVPNHLIADFFGSYKKGYKRGDKKSNWRWKEYFNLKEVWNKEKICLVVDEAHEFKNVKAVKTRALASHKRFFDYRILLSATPAINYFEDWWSGFNLLDQSIIPMSYNAFKIFISKEIGDNHGIYSISSYNTDNMISIKKAFEPNILKRLKTDLPEMKTRQIITPVYLDMNTKMKLMYQVFIQNQIHKISEEYDSVSFKLIFEKFPYLLQIIDNPLLLRNKVDDVEFNRHLSKWKFENDPRIVWLDNAFSDYIDALDEKVVVFDTHPDTLDSLALRYKKYNPLVIHGRLRDSKEDRLIKEDLYNDPNNKHKILFIQTQIGGAGFNFHKGGRRIIFFTLPYDSTLFRQALDRCYRITSTQHSVVEIPLLDHSIDLIRYKRNMNRLLLNDNILKKSLNREELKNLFLGTF